jgi:hypothetical protein
VADVSDEGVGGYGTIRSVAVVNDAGTWRFSQFGRPFPFEEVATYGVRAVRERLTIPMLIRYAHALGVPVFDEGFYEHDAVLVARQPLRDAPSLTIPEARRFLELGGMQ